ncbi:MAG: AAA family ATPase [Desulfuromonadaceae bacterium]
MYTEYFGLRDRPFSIAPDPEYLYMSPRHREALAHLIYGLQTDGGFVLLTGEVGTGKTTVCRCLLEQVPDDAEIAFVLNPKLSAAELLETICDELGIDYPAHTTSIKVFVDAINHFLLDTHARGRKTVLIIDEAQNLSIDVLEQIRLLTNLETNKQKLLQVIMIGQPELRDMLKRQELRQLEQRVTARYHLQPLNYSETRAYISHRLQVAGVERPLFSRRALRMLYRFSGGIPRLINLLCDRALLGAYATNQNSVTTKLVRSTAKEIFGAEPEKRIFSRLSTRTLAAVVGILLLAGGLIAFSIGVPTGSDSELPSSTPLPERGMQSHESTPPPELAQTQNNTATPQEPVWDAGLWDNATHQAAVEQLFSLWGEKSPSEDEDIANSAAQAGLSPLERRGSLATLRELNRPAILILQDDTGRNRFATLTGLDENHAVLSFAQHILRVEAAELVKHWRGDFILLWQPPSDYSTPVYPGHEGEIVTWLDRKLALINTRPPAEGLRLSLKGRLLDELRQFQAAKGLTPDGILGPVTLIHLRNVSSNNYPALQPDSRKQGKH